MKKQYLRLLTALLTLPLIMGSCAKEGEDIVPDGGEGTLVTLSVSVPGNRTPSSRALTTADESEVAEIDLLLFHVASAGGGFVHHTRVGEVPIDNNRQGVFSVRLPEGTYDIVLIANASDEVASVVPIYNTLSDKRFAQETLEFNQSGKWPAASPSHRPIPMWGELNGAVIQQGSSFSGVYLMRAMAKINVEVDPGANFTMSEIYLYNPAEDGYVIPWASSVSGTPPQVTDYSADVSWTRKTTPHHYSGTEVSAYACKNEIYTFETPAGDGTPDIGPYLNDGNTYLVIGGKWNGETSDSWYRIDFATQDRTYLPLLRNHRYEVVIENVPFRGESSPAAAANAGPSNIQAELVVRNEADMHYYVYDDQYFLGADDREIRVSADGGSFSFDVRTDYPHGWTAAASDSATDPTAGVAGAWLTLTTTSGGLGTDPLAFTVDANPVIAPRETYIHITADDRLHAVVKVRQIFKFDFLNLIQTPLSKGYVGAFWRADQTGERLIKITRSFQDTPSSIDGTWTATVVEGDDWIVLDTEDTTDGNIYTSNAADMIANDAVYQVNSTLTSVTGDAGTTEDIYFRIGLKNTIASGEHRYGIILLTYNNDTKNHVIFIRQGKDPDYVMKPTDNNMAGDLETETGGTAAEPRPYAVKYSPFNLTAAGYRDNTSTDEYIPVGARGGVFTNYPSQAGAYFQWANNYNPAYAWNPWTATVSIWDTTHPGAVWDNMKSTHETCPSGYRRPTDGVTNNYNTAGTLTQSEQRQSLYLNLSAYNSSVTHANVGNVVWGYYADGFFDRRPIVTSIGSSTYINSAVETGTADLGYIGLLYYNPWSYESLFFPAAGGRIESTAGALDYAGGNGNYWSASAALSMQFWSQIFSSTSAYQDFGMTYYALSVRCVPE